MKEIYNQNYYENYHVGCGEVRYEDSAYTKEFLTKVATQIVEDFGPKTVLDAGCAMGHLVAALRDLGVEAYGIDISDYAVTSAREDIRPYLHAQSLTEPLPDHFPQTFDLVINIEVIEHMRMDEGIKAIENFSKITDTVIFSSTSDGIEDPTHVNVQQPEYWIEQYAEYGFYNKIDYHPNYISEHAICFYKSNNLPRILGDYERNIRLSKIHQADIVKAESKKMQTAVVRYDMGHGFQDSNATFFTYSNFLLSEKITFDSSVQSVRLDPVENSGCLIKNIVAISNLGPIEYLFLNGEPLNDTLLFLDDDPQLIFDISQKNIRWIEFMASVYPINDILLIDFMTNIKKTIEQAEKEIEEAKKEKEINQTNYNMKYSDLNTKYNYKNTLLDSKEVQLDGIKKRLQTVEHDRQGILLQLSIEQQQKLDFQQNYNAISNSIFWKITKPGRWFVDRLKAIIRKSPLIHKGLLSLRYFGFRETIYRIQARGNYPEIEQSDDSISRLSKNNRIQQMEEVFKDNITFSILVPLYNTDRIFLKDMIHSVQSQTYKKWELCLADGSDNDHNYVGEYCKKLAINDPRIQYMKLKKNQGISENTNEALKMATGQYIGLLDHDDILHEAALYENMKIIEETSAEFIYSDELTFENDVNKPVLIHYKPDFASDNLRANNYICHFTVFAKKLQEKTGFFRPEFDGSQDHDMVLRLTEQANIVEHIPKVLYFWRAHEGSVAQDIGSKPYVIEAGINAVKSQLDRLDIAYDSVEETFVSSAYKINYTILGTPLVSIIIPNKDQVQTLKTCINSILYLTNYENIEIIIVENNSTQDETFEYYEELKQIDGRIKIVHWEGDFNYPLINNFGVEHAKGEHFILLNNDVEIISSNWIEEMLMYSQQSRVGVVGAKLYYPDNTIQHGGVILGIGGVANHAFKNFPREHPGYMGRLAYAQNLSVVTAACLMVKASVYHEVNGLDPVFKVAFNDVDFCLRIREKGYLNIFTPFAELFHHESKSRGRDDTPERIDKFHHEIITFRTRWRKELKAGDPYYNPNLTLGKEDFSFKIN